MWMLLYSWAARSDLCQNHRGVNKLINVCQPLSHLIHTCRNSGSKVQHFLTQSSIWSWHSLQPIFSHPQQQDDLTANAHQGGYNISLSISYIDQPKAPAVLGTGMMRHVTTTTTTQPPYDWVRFQLMPSTCSADSSSSTRHQSPHDQQRSINKTTTWSELKLPGRMRYWIILFSDW